MLPIMLASNGIASADTTRQFAIAVVTALPIAGLGVVLAPTGAEVRLVVVRSNPLRPTRRSPLIAYVGHLALYLSLAASVCELGLASGR
jgi:hypothetical protein